MDYQGPERRTIGNMDQYERDLLIRIDANLTNLKQIFEIHVEADQLMFLKQTTDIDFLKKMVFIGLGGIGIFQIFIKLLFK